MSIFKDIINEITEQYLEEDNNRPWIVAFSGGKDSTLMLQLTWQALQSIPSELKEDQNLLATTAHSLRSETIRKITN